MRTFLKSIVNVFIVPSTDHETELYFQQKIPGLDQRENVYCVVSPPWLCYMVHIRRYRGL